MMWRLAGLLVLVARVATAATPTSLDATWTAPTTNEDGTPLGDLLEYRLYASTSTPSCPSATYQRVTSPTASPAPNTTIGATITGLLPNTTYSVQVTAVDTAGKESTCSTVATGKTLVAVLPVNVTGVGMAYAASPQYFASDTFNRANGPLAGSWTTNGYTVTNNRAMVSVLVNDSDAYWSAVAWPANQVSQARLYATGTSGNTAGNGLSVRNQGGKTYYRFVVDHAATNNVTLTRFNAGVSTTLKVCAVTWVDGETWRFEATTPTNASVRLRLYKNDVQVCGDFFDTAPTRLLTGAPGLAFSSGGQSAATADDWQGAGL